ncbi:MAG: ferrous iron transport protein A [Saprospiraceae bacterium]|nr:ferrous iron transport protein A [Saprospiraceae bacterium]HMW40075.1 FeoA family protein [Saprospiraceae bacterium]HMX88655.1 FeoA family protein [Saprospiraceae bacterium]HMZ41276.1 FeoA family protein [Saprospiraceae bacterium]HNA65330.1 FeoA family protein [Saprospiraceae bacterium]
MSIKVRQIISIRDPELAVRFFTIGIYPGKYIELIRQAPFGGAYFVQVDQLFFVLRKKEWEALETKIVRT